MCKRLIKEVLPGASGGEWGEVEERRKGEDSEQRLISSKPKPQPDPAGSSGMESTPHHLSQSKAKELSFHTSAPVIGKGCPVGA